MMRSFGEGEAADARLVIMKSPMQSAASTNLVLYQVDAFTAVPFRGNPAGVCMLQTALDESRMQAIAQEMNLSETAFLVPKQAGERGRPEFDLRWFTPVAEVELCGHATLAAAHVLWETGVVLSGEQIGFLTLSGRLLATQAGGWVRLEFPALPESPASPPPGLDEALGERATYVGRNRFDYLVELDSEEKVSALAPDFAALKRLGVRGVIVTAVADRRQEAGGGPEYDFVSRFFAPAFGVDEDPVTGSAHCCLGPYWASRLAKQELTGYQASARGGSVRVTPLPNGPERDPRQPPGYGRGDRVLLEGQATTVMKIELLA
jgi:predicted PhzF superfamily epimerase YddE/YHI9